MATVKELRAKAKSLFFKGYSKMNKAELEKLISDYEASEEAFRDMDPLTHSQQSTTTTQQEQQVTFGVTFEIGADDDNIPVSQEPPIRDDDVLIPEVEVAAETNADLLALMELEEMFDIARIVNYTDCKEVARELYYECDCSLDGVRKRIIRRLSCKIGTFELVKNAPSMSFDDYMKVVNVKGTDYLRFDLAEITGKDYSHFEHFSREKCVKDMIAYYHKVAPLALSEHASLHEQAQPEIHEATQADPEQPQQEPATVEETQSSPATTTEKPEHASNPAPSTQYNTEKTTHINSTQELFNICIERNGLDNVVIYFDEKHSLKIRDIQDITRKVFSWCDCSYPRKWSHFANPYQSLIDEIATFIGVDEPDASKRNNTVCTWLRDKKEEYEVTGKKPVMLKDELRPSQDNGRKLGTFTFTFTKNKQKQSMNFTVSIFEFEDRPLYRKIFGKVLQLTDTEGKIAARFSPYSDSLQLAFDFRYALKGKKTIASLEKQFRAVVQSFLTKAKLLDKQGHLIPDGNEDIRALWEEYYDSHYKPIWERNAPSAPQQEPETVQEVTSEVTPELVTPLHWNL